MRLLLRLRENKKLGRKGGEKSASGLLPETWKGDGTEKISPKRRGKQTDSRRALYGDPKERKHAFA